MKSTVSTAKITGDNTFVVYIRNTRNYSGLQMVFRNPNSGLYYTFSSVTPSNFEVSGSHTVGFFRTSVQPIAEVATCTANNKHKRRKSKS
jgi:hypothetical protein